MTDPGTDPGTDPMGAEWDVIVVGAGMGGGLAARALAEGGMRVLIVERGMPGRRAEETRIDAALADPVARAVRGLWPEPLEVVQDGVAHRFHAALGSGPGGSSVFYAATLERPEPFELDPWPVPYAAMAPWYSQAEAWLSVASNEEKSLSPSDIAIMDRLRGNGMSPHRLGEGLRRVPGCLECLGSKCPRLCKMDGRSAGVEPALATGRALMLTGCEAVRVAPGEVEVAREGERVVLRAPRVVLALGALSTPRLLMASGIGGDAAGRYLMLHLNETFAVWPGGGDSRAGGGPSKAVGLRDLMRVDGRPMGMVQAMGIDVRAGEVLHYLRERWGDHPWGRSRLAREGMRLPAALAARALGTARLFVGLLEDRADPGNRVMAGERIVATYAIPEETRERRAIFRKAIKKAFRGLRPAFIHSGAEPNWGHACGTTRMGADPATSVVDAGCRVHGADALWVVDAGVFPTSMGVNPSLTIAANALRVAHAILGGR